jgi:hypothetical protein
MFSERAKGLSAFGLGGRPPLRRFISASMLAACCGFFFSNIMTKCLGVSSQSIQESGREPQGSQDTKYHLLAFCPFSWRTSTSKTSFTVLMTLFDVKTRTLPDAARLGDIRRGGGDGGGDGRFWAIECAACAATLADNTRSWRWVGSTVTPGAARLGDIRRGGDAKRDDVRFPWTGNWLCLERTLASAAAWSRARNVLPAAFTLRLSLLSTSSKSPALLWNLPVRMFRVATCVALQGMATAPAESSVLSCFIASSARFPGLQTGDGLRLMQLQ